MSSHHFQAHSAKSLALQHVAIPIYIHFKFLCYTHTAVLYTIGSGGDDLLKDGCEGSRGQRIWVEFQKGVSIFTGFHHIWVHGEIAQVGNLVLRCHALGIHQTRALGGSEQICMQLEVEEFGKAFLNTREG